MSKIILIDDDYATEVLVENLALRGFEARRINSATAALASIEDIAAADLVILDIIMERPPNSGGSQISGARTTGLALVKVLREKNQNLPILVFSATTDRDLIDSISSIPRTSFLSKWNTHSIRDLVEEIESAIGGPTKKILPRSFIVHGHDTAAKLELKNYLQNVLGFPEPIILHEQPSVGRTIIEKFETYASHADLAFVLLTPDDKMASEGESNDERRRARQNVIFELGYCLGVFGRHSGRVFLLHKGSLDLPSDLSGVVYIDVSKGIAAAGDNIRLELANVK